MTDELMERRLRQGRAAQQLLSARIALNARARELLPHKAAIVELLHAVAIVMERTGGKRTTEVGLVSGVSAALGVTDQQSWEILKHVLQEAEDE